MLHMILVCICSNKVYIISIYYLNGTVFFDGAVVNVLNFGYVSVCATCYCCSCCYEHIYSIHDHLCVWHAIAISCVFVCAPACSRNLDYFSSCSWNCISNDPNENAHLFQISTVSFSLSFFEWKREKNGKTKLKLVQMNRSQTSTKRKK